MPAIRPIYYGRQDISSEDIQTVVEVLQGDFLTQGPWVEKFERSFAEFVHAPHAIAVMNGTAALHLAVLALGIKPKQKVLTTPITFAASANAVLYSGGEVEFVDIDPKTACICPRALEERLSKATTGEFAGIIAVDFAGHSADLKTISEIARKYGVWLLEDACHAPGGYQITDDKQRYCGSGTYTDASVFSFHPVKHITSGEGGMITVNNNDIATKIRTLRTHGIVRDSTRLVNPKAGPWYYEMQELGFNYRLPDVACALGWSQLQRLNQFLERRRQMAARYDQSLKDLPGRHLTPGAYKTGHAYHLYVWLEERRDELFAFLNAREIFPQVHYIPVHTMPYYQQRYPENANHKLKHAESFYSQAMSLPLYPSLSDDDQNRVIAAVREFYGT
jgi:UDP-4-amino-4,6-dideoxy-N-acetyl-beta-L-altrosamine transaminase